MTVRFYTLFDRRYATRGLVMLESVQAHCNSDDEFVVLALDDDTRRLLEKFPQPRRRVVMLEDIDDHELLEVKKTRPWREFCWTCTPALSSWMVRNGAENDIVVYLDADLLFFRDPQILLKELDNGGAILVHEHRFSADRAAWESPLYRFNVGFVAFRVCAEARACVERWRAQVIEHCGLDVENGYVGDQGYLVEWPKLYPNLRVMQNIGGGVAPWNIGQYRIGRNGRGPTVDHQEIVFFHYHALKTLADPTFGFVAVQPAYGYEMTRVMHDLVFRPYVKQLRKVTRSVRWAGFAVESDRVVYRKELLQGLIRGRYLLAC
jgi:Nucleotide-diphospho-sugar transferase